jgi:protein SCO1/2
MRWFAAAMWSILLIGQGVAQVNETVDALDGVGIDERPNAQLPLELQFCDSRGRSMRLGDLFNGTRPVLLALNYSDCPMLCQLQLNGLVEGLREMDWDAGEQFEVCSVSINPLETPHRARQVKQRYIQAYGRPGTAAGWHFLTGNQAAIAELAQTVGFRFRYVPETREYAHAAAVMVCTPEGRLSRYLYGVAYPPQTLKMSLVEAGDGRIGSTLDRVMLYCFHYDATLGRYAPVARRLMQVAAALTLATLGLTLVPIWLRRYRLARRSAGTVLRGLPQ